MPATDAVSESPVCFPALDGYPLGGTLFVPNNLKVVPIAGVLSCGGGILAARYRNFARYLAANGVPILTYDYRGIGNSRPTSLRGFKAVAEDWSELDCGGAIAYVRSRFIRANLVGIAHSIGALLAGGAPNIAELKRFVFIGAHTGYYGDYMPTYRLPMAILWHGVMPIVTRVVGYFPAKFLRIGEDIPAGIAMQWAARRSPDLQPEATTIDAKRARTMIARYQDVAGKALSVGFTDDAFATEMGMRRLLSEFPKLNSEVRKVAPKDVGMKSIGHFGFFRREAQPRLWPTILPFIWEESGRPPGLPMRIGNHRSPGIA